MKVEEIGEIGLIERISKRFISREKAIIVGAGKDDCAVIDLEVKEDKNKYLVVTTDMLQESTHFPIGISPYQIGWSAVAASLSDIAAMGARPFSFTIAMGIPEGTEIAFLDGLVEGMEKCASSYHTEVVGGDITRSKELILAGTCFGFADKLVRRAGAKVGDLVCVTGFLGNAALGMKIIKEDIKVKVPKRVEEEMKKAIFQPLPRVKEGVFLANSGIATSMMDISDGLSLSLAEIAKRSKVGMEIYEDKVPIRSEIKGIEGLSSGLEHDTSLRELAFYYGGDYELLFTADEKALAFKDKIELNRLKREVKMSIIGKVVPPEEGIHFKKGEEREKMEIKGYQHF
jgi:thiamine-monophosphate kinase